MHTNYKLMYFGGNINGNKGGKKFEGNKLSLVSPALKSSVARVQSIFNFLASASKYSVNCNFVKV